MTKNNQSTEVVSFSSVWDALGDTPAEAENMRIRADLMKEIREFVKRHNLTQAQAAKYCQVTAPRMSDLMNGRISKFSIDALVNMAASAKLKVSVAVQEEASA